MTIICPKDFIVRYFVNAGVVITWSSVFFNLFNPGYYTRFEMLIFWFLYLVPIFFYTRYLWVEKSRNRIFFGIPEKLKFNLKKIEPKIYTNTSNADELKKYADLRDQGIITEEEFEAKKKKLLDL